MGRVWGRRGFMGLSQSTEREATVRGHRENGDIELLWDKLTRPSLNHQEQPNMALFFLSSSSSHQMR
jgi:hypothetical protein